MSRPKAEQSRSCFPAELPLHLVEVEILSRLPAKSLLKFRSVCRSWRAFIDTPRFINLHYQKSKAKPPLFITTSDLTPTGVIKLDSGWHPCSFYSRCRHRQDIGEQKSANEELLIPVLLEEDLEYVTLESTSNGLLLYSGSSNSWGIHLVNPATKQRIQLPSFSHYRYNICFMKILFDASSDAYKVLMGYKTQREEIDPDNLPQPRVLIFTLGVDTTWRKLACPITRLVWCNRIREHEVVNGAIHINHDDFYRVRRGFDEEYIECILAFNIKEESFRIIEHPNCCSPNMKTRSNCNKIEESYFNGRHSVHVVGIDGLLYLIHVDVYRTIMDVWLLEDYNNGLWIKKSSFTLYFIHKKLGFAFEDLEDAFDVEPCAVIHGQLMLKVSSNVSRNGYHYTILWYDPKLGRLLDMDTTSDTHAYQKCFPFLLGTYVESLVRIP